MGSKSSLVLSLGQGQSNGCKRAPRGPVSSKTATGACKKRTKVHRGKRQVREMKGSPLVLGGHTGSQQ